MKTITTKLQLDFLQSDSFRTIHVKQGDAGGSRQIEIELLDNGEIVPLVSGDTAQLYASVGRVVTANGESCPINANKIYVNVGDNLTGIAGLERCDVVISNNGKIIHTATFNLYVGAAAVNSDTDQYIPSQIPTSGIEALQESLDALENRVTLVENDVYDLKQSMSSAQSDISDLKNRMASVETETAWLHDQVNDLLQKTWWHIEMESYFPVMIDPRLTRYEYSEEAANLGYNAGYQVYTIPSTEFDPETDGILFFHDLLNTIISPEQYTITKNGTNAVVRFYNSNTSKSVTVLGTLRTFIFIRPRVDEGE